MARAIAAIMALMIVAIGGVAAFEASLENAGDNVSITNETWTPDAGNITTLDESNRDGAYYSNQTTVYDENGTLMDRGTDYEWNPGNGTVKAIVGGDLDGDSSAKISYSFQQTTAEQRSLAGLLALIPKALAVLFPVFIFVIFLLVIR